MGSVGPRAWLCLNVPHSNPPQPTHPPSRSRAHCNPLSHNDAFDYPSDPSKMDWRVLYPQVADPVVRFLDVGCGFGGLTGACLRASWLG